MAEHDPVTDFIERVDRLEKRYKGDKFAERWLMPRDLVIAVRDELKQPKLFREKVEKMELTS